MQNDDDADWLCSAALRSVYTLSTGRFSKWIRTNFGWLSQKKRKKKEKHTKQMKTGLQETNNGLRLSSCSTSSICFRPLQDSLGFSPNVHVQGSGFGSDVHGQSHKVDTVHFLANIYLENTADMERHQQHSPSFQLWERNLIFQLSIRIELKRQSCTCKSKTMS